MRGCDRAQILGNLRQVNILWRWHGKTGKNREGCTPPPWTPPNQNMDPLVQVWHAPPRICRSYKWHCGTGPGGGGRARSLYTTPLTPGQTPPPDPRQEHPPPPDPRQDRPPDPRLDPPPSFDR